MIKQSELANKVKIAAQEAKDSSATSVLVMVKTGSRNETPDNNGISHFLEHMNFKGTKNRPTTFEISKELDSVGAEYNAFTSKEYTGYYVKSDKKHFGLALDLLSDMIFSSALLPSEIAKESGTIIEEINMYEDTPMSFVPDLFELILFSKPEVAQYVIGNKKNILAVDAKKMLDYRNKYYTAGNTYVSVAGAIPYNYLEQIHHYFKNIDGPTVDYYTSGAENPHVKTQCIIRFKETEQAHLVFGVPSFVAKNDDKYAANILAVILGGNMSSRLFREIREKRGLAYYVKANAEDGSDFGSLTIRAGVNISKAEEAVKIIKEEMVAISENITEQEIRMAKDFIKGTLALQEEDSLNVAVSNAEEITLGLAPISMSAKAKIYDKLTSKHIKKVAEELFTPTKMKLAMIGPLKDESKFIKILEG